MSQARDLAPAARPPSRWREAWRVYRRSGSAMLGAVLLLIIVAATVLGPMLMGVDPMEMVGAPMLPPGSEGALLGTDYLGRDLLAQIVQGGRATLAVGMVAALVSVFLGVTIGALAGYYGDWVDEALMRVIEFFQVMPTLLLAMVLVTLFGPTLWTVALSLGVASWPATARLARGEFLRLKRQDYVLAERMSGARNARIIWRVILPNAMAPLMVSATLAIGVAVLYESGLAFLGLGDPNLMSWGLMIGNNRPYVLTAWWTVTLPGAAIFLTVLAVSLVGDGLNDALNPRLRERS